MSNRNAIAGKVKQGLGFTLQMTALDTDAVTRQAVTRPRSYDVADIEYFAVKQVFPTGVMQPMDTKRIKLFVALLHGHRLSRRRHVVPLVGAPATVRGGGASAVPCRLT
ncbi:MAG: hypothetical protein ABSC95_21455 [Acetobacteraceae bacterium]